MTHQPSTTTALNPFAPEYNPIAPGVTPSPHGPLPSFLPPPSPRQTPSSAQPAPPQLILSPQIFTYIPSSSQPRLYTNYSTYCFTPQNTISTTPQPPQEDVVIHDGQSGRGFTRRRRGFGGGRGRGRGRESCWRRRAENNGRDFNLNFERRQNNEKNSVGFPKNEIYFSSRGMHKEENRHEVIPLERDEENTTVMIKNIPYDCPRKELINLLDDFCLLENGKAANEGTSKEEEAEEVFPYYAYDFLYLPIDFRSKRSRGFAFVNFTNAKAAWKFFDALHMKQKWDLLSRKHWPKKIEIVSAKIQGKEALVNHFSESIFECETDEFLPACFSPPRDGTGQPAKLTVVGNRKPETGNRFASGNPK